MSIKRNSFVGSKFFDKYGNIVRVKSVRNKNLFIIKDGDELRKIRFDDLKENYTRLKPNGIVSIFEVDIGNGNKDVICTLHRSIDMDNRIEIPYVAARVCIVNMFGGMLENDINKIPIGMCMSNMTCPANVNFSIMLEYRKLISNSIISVYIDDTIDTVLEYVNTVNYDNIISRTRKRFDPYKIKNIGDSLREFLINNGWMQEWNNAYNIINLESDCLNIKNNEVKGNMVKLQSKIERSINYTIDILGIIKYDETVNLDKLTDKEHYIGVRNNNEENTVYFVKYVKHNKLLVIPSNQKQYAKQLIDRLYKP